MIPFPSPILMAGYVVVPGSQNYTTPGTYSFVVPNYNKITVTNNGGAGGSGTTEQYGSQSGATGGTVTFASSTPIHAYGGTGGGSGYTAYACGCCGAYSYAAQGGNGSDGGGDGPTGCVVTVGGGASSGGYHFGPDSQGEYGGAGGNGGKVVMVWTNTQSGMPAPGSTITVTVAANSGGYNSGPNGSCLISWS